MADRLLLCFRTDLAGFEDCIAVLNGDSASIIVKSQDLQAAEIAQINAIVYEQTGIVPGGVTIITK